MIALEALSKSSLLMERKFVEESSFKVVVYQHTLIQKVRITLGYVVKYEDTNTERLTALVVLMQLTFHPMPTTWMAYPLHTEVILANTFTYASGCSESGSCWSSSECPCQTGATSVFPKFLGYNDFYCESGSYWHPGGRTLYTEPLWDGKNCDWKEAPCCTSSRLPWFYQALPTATSHNIEFRVCSAGNKNDEDITFDQVEFYIK